MHHTLRNITSIARSIARSLIISLFLLHQKQCVTPWGFDDASNDKMMDSSVHQFIRRTCLDFRSREDAARILFFCPSGGSWFWTISKSERVMHGELFVFWLLQTTNTSRLLLADDDDDHDHDLFFWYYMLLLLDDDDEEHDEHDGCSWRFVCAGWWWWWCCCWRPKIPLVCRQFRSNGACHHRDH